MPNPKSNHFYIEKNYSDFFNNSKILNADRTEAVTKRENFLLLAALGYYCGFRTEFENSRAKASDIFVMNQLRDNELSLLYAIAIAETGDLEVVNDDIKVADIAMEFANTGISVFCFRISRGIPSLFVSYFDIKCTPRPPPTKKKGLI